MKFTILGCGGSVGSPWITGYWGNCDKKNKYNLRTRCSAFFKKGNISVLIDTSPDIKKQLLDNKIQDIYYVLYTHEHAPYHVSMLLYSSIMFVKIYYNTIF